MAASDSNQRLRKELGLFKVYAIATGTTLSAGLFLLPGIAVQHAGPSMILAYVVATIPLIPAMFSAVELATAMPRAGGVYYFLDRSMGPVVGTIGGLGTWLALVLKTTFALIGMGAYVNLLLPDINGTFLAILFAVLFGALNLMGAKGAATFQALLVTGLLGLLAAFIGGGSLNLETANFSPFFTEGVHGLFYTAGLVYISYVGITKVASVSEEIKNPERNLPLGVFLSLGTSIFIYVAATTIMIGVIGSDQLAGDYTPMASTAEAIFGKPGLWLIILAAVLAFSSVANAGIMSASRYPLAMSRDKLLPPVFSGLSRKGYPRFSIQVTVGLMVVLLLFFQPEKIVKLASAFQLLMFALVCVAVIVMRESRLDSYDPGYRSPFYPWMQIFGVLAAIWLMAQMGAWPLFFACLLIAVGVWWYFHYASGKITRTGAIYHIFERLGHRRYAELDGELRGILKEKGLRAGDPFDDIVARAQIVDVSGKAVFEDVARRAAQALSQRIPATPDHILAGFLRGTQTGATPVAGGAALPHLRLPDMEHPEVVLARVPEGVHIDLHDEFGEEQDPENFVQAVFFLISPEADPGRHLRILAQIAGKVDDDQFMPIWLAAKDEQDLKECLLRDERYLSLRLSEDRPGSELIGKSLRHLQLPPGCLVALVRRGDLTFVPHADTLLATHDRLTLIGEPEGIAMLYKQYTC